jgi:hypothetical protein
MILVIRWLLCCAPRAFKVKQHRNRSSPENHLILQTSHVVNVLFTGLGDFLLSWSNVHWESRNEAKVHISHSCG